MIKRKMPVPFGTVDCEDAYDEAHGLAEAHPGAHFYVVDVLEGVDDWRRWQEATNGGQFEGAGWTYVVDEEGLAVLGAECYGVAEIAHYTAPSGD